MIHTNTLSIAEREYKDNFSKAQGLITKLYKTEFTCDDVLMKATYVKMRNLDALVDKVKKYSVEHGLHFESKSLIKGTKDIRVNVYGKLALGIAGNFAVKILPFYAGVLFLSSKALDGTFSESYELTRSDLLSNVVPVSLIGASLGMLTGCIYPSKDMFKNIKSVASNAFFGTLYIANSTLTAPYLSNGLENVCGKNAMNTGAAVLVTLAAERVLRLVGGY